MYFYELSPQSSISNSIIDKTKRNETVQLCSTLVYNLHFNESFMKENIQ